MRLYTMNAADWTERYPRMVEEAARLRRDAVLDCGVICTDHTSFDYQRIAASLALVVDTRNALKGLELASIFRV